MIFGLQHRVKVSCGIALLIVISSFAYSQRSRITMPNIVQRLTNPDYADGKKRSAFAAANVNQRLTKELSKKGLQLGSPVFIRIFKESKELEFWIQKEQAFELFKTYNIAAMSGTLGPKLAEGDSQAPEGFYAVSQRLMNPQSRYHLAFNIGYPNTYDKAHQRTGSAIMVHGNQVSIGCFAMTDFFIEEIYTLCDAALKKGQPFFRVHSFPFRLTEGNLATHSEHASVNFWRELQPGYAHFEQSHRPPNVRMEQAEYSFEAE